MQTILHIPQTITFVFNVFAIHTAVLRNRGVETRRNSLHLESHQVRDLALARTLARTASGSASAEQLFLEQHQKTNFNAADQKFDLSPPHLTSLHHIHTPLKHG